MKTKIAREAKYYESNRTFFFLSHSCYEISVKQSRDFEDENSAEHQVWVLHCISFDGVFQVRLGEALSNLAITEGLVLGDF